MNLKLPQAETVADLDLVVGREVVHLVEVLQADAVLLGDGVHRLSWTDIVQTVLIVPRGLRLLLLQPDDLTLLQLVALVALVILGQLTITDIHLVSQRAERVSLAGNDIVVLVVVLDGVQDSIDPVILGTIGHELVIVLGLVVLIEFVKLDNLYQFAGVLGVRGIARRLQSSGPALVVSLLQVEQRLIAAATDQELGVILEGLIGGVVGAEALVALVIVVITRAPRPSVALDTKMVVGPPCQFTVACPTLKHALSQCDGGRDMILEHLLDGNILVLVEILLICLIPSDLGRAGKRQQQGYG